MIIDPVPGAGNVKKPWASARRYYLRHRYGWLYPLLPVLVIVCVFSFICLLSMMLETKDDFIARIICAAMFALICLGAALAVIYHLIDRSARYFASEAVDDGNLTEQEIATFYEAYIH